MDKQPLPPGWIAPARRKSPRIAHYDYSLPGTYFVTLCTYASQCLFGTVVDGEIQLSETGRIVNSCWLDIPRHFVTIELDLYVVMPNHLHGLLTIDASRDAASTDKRPNLNAMVGSFKSAATRKVNAAKGKPGAQLWQRAYYDHAVRTDQGLERIRKYIADNPLKWELDEENPERRRR